MEDQATDRAHRIGQTKDVDVIRLIAQGTIEEKVTDLSKRKRAIFDRVVLAGGNGAGKPDRGRYPKPVFFERDR